MLLTLLAPLCLTLSPAVEITSDMVLDPAKTYGPLIIKASNITIDGRGAAVIGKAAGEPRDFTGMGNATRQASYPDLRDSTSLQCAERLHAPRNRIRPAVAEPIIPTAGPLTALRRFDSWL